MRTNPDARHVRIAHRRSRVQNAGARKALAPAARRLHPPRTSPSRIFLHHSTTAGKLAPMHYRKRLMRRRNYNDPGHAHGLTCSCYHGFRLLSSDRSCEWLARAIDDARRELDFALWAYVFMPNHVHLIVWPRRPQYEIEEIRSAIKQSVARKAMAWPRKHAPYGLPRLRERRARRDEYHFWQPGGGFDRNVIEPAALEKEIEYIHLNPARKRLVLRAADWKWFSAGWFQGCPLNWLEPDPIPPEWTVGMSA